MMTTFMAVLLTLCESSMLQLVKRFGRGKLGYYVDCGEQDAQVQAYAWVIRSSLCILPRLDGWNPDISVTFRLFP
jgi:hypothetical protein